jgi:hypothetical protein
VSERDLKLTPEMLEGMKTYGLMIGPEIAWTTRPIESTTTVIDYDQDEEDEIASFDTLVLQHDGRREAIWATEVTEEELTVVRGFPTIWPVRSWPEGTGIHRILWSWPDRARVVDEQKRTSDPVRESLWMGGLPAPSHSSERDMLVRDEVSESREAPEGELAGSSDDGHESD